MVPDTCCACETAGSSSTRSSGRQRLRKSVGRMQILLNLIQRTPSLYLIIGACWRRSGVAVSGCASPRRKNDCRRAPYVCNSVHAFERTQPRPACELPSIPGNSISRLAQFDQRDMECSGSITGYCLNAATPASATAWSFTPELPLTPTAPTTWPPRLMGMPPAKIMILPLFEA